MPPAGKLQIGPWKGGLNIREDAQLIADNQLSEATNVLIDDDGSLKHRFGFKTAPDPLGLPVDIDLTWRYVYLGEYAGNILWAKTHYDGINYPYGDVSSDIVSGLIDTTTQTVSMADTHMGLPATDITIGYAVKALEYLNFIVIVWSKGHVQVYDTTGMSAIDFSFGPYPSTVTIPSPCIGEKGVLIWKDRLFYASTDGKIYYSAATDLTNFTAPDGGYFTVGTEAIGDFFPGSEYINSMIVVNNTLYIFKDKSTYAFTYQVDPATDGYLRVINEVHGAMDVATWNSRIFTTDTDSIYEFVGGRYLDIGISLLKGLSLNSYSGREIIVYRDLLIVGPLDSDTTGINPDIFYYVMNLHNGAWFKWVPYGYTDKGLLTYNSDTSGKKAVYPYGGEVVNQPYGNTNIPLWVGNASVNGRVAWAGYINSLEINSSDTAVDMAVTATKDDTIVRKVPQYKIKTKEFVLTSPWLMKKVHKVLVDRGIGISETGSTLTTADRQGGFGVEYTTPPNLNAGVKSTVISSPPDAFGTVAAGGSFRCLSFKLTFSFGYANQDVRYVNSADSILGFNINGFQVNVSVGADYGNVMTLP